MAAGAGVSLQQDLDLGLESPALFVDGGRRLGKGRHDHIEGAGPGDHDPHVGLLLDRSPALTEVVAARHVGHDLAQAGLGADGTPQPSRIFQVKGREPAAQ